MKIGLNVGSGQRPFHSTEEVQWINIDKIAREGMPKPDLVCDGERLPYPDSYADYFVLHHCLEHFGCNDGAGLVKEAFRVLAPNGKLQVYVPNLRALAHRWLIGEMDTQLFMTNVYGAYAGHEEDRHRWGFDAISLADFLRRNAEWSSVTVGQIPNVSGSDAAHDWWILEAECTK